MKNALLNSLFALCLTAGYCTCSAQDVLLVHSRQKDTVQGPEIARLITFLGLNLEEREPQEVAAYVASHSRGRGKASTRLVAIVVFADDLASVDPSTLRRINGGPSAKIPNLLYGVNDHTSATELGRWSEGGIEDCRKIGIVGNPGELQFGDDFQIDKQLANLRIPSVSIPNCRISGPAMTGRQVLQTSWPTAAPAALLSRIETSHGELFLTPEVTAQGNGAKGNSESLIPVFSKLAPYLLFLKYAAKDFTWHLDGEYANLTIDDPWLVEPYGNLHYEELLDEMRRHKFHTTIAFVPWNFERNTKQVVETFKQNPEYFSICIHGDNHEHREFGAYSEVPLERQQRNIRQSVLRMEAMQEKTGLHYDRFMVFPHGVAPEETFRALHRNGFLGTANSINVPLDRPAPVDPFFWMKTYSEAYGDIVSLSRVSVEGPVSMITAAIQLYLGNPLLFYGHQQMFSSGSDAFNSIANAVNRIQPETRWVSLGVLSKHLYETRRRSNKAIDVRMFTHAISLPALADDQMVYSFTYKIAPHDVIAGVEIDGHSVAWEQSSDQVAFTFRPHDQLTHDVNVIYKTPATVFSEDTRSEDTKIALLRRISDFRDMNLSRYSWGRQLVDLYYDEGGRSFERLVEQWWPAAAALLLFGLGVWRVVRQQRRRGMQAAEGN